MQAINLSTGSHPQVLKESCIKELVAQIYPISIQTRQLYVAIMCTIRPMKIELKTIQVLFRIHYLANDNTRRQHFLIIANWTGVSVNHQSIPVEREFSNTMPVTQPFTPLSILCVGLHMLQTRRPGKRRTSIPKVRRHSSRRAAGTPKSAA